jgi:hypothetical protein
MITGAILLVGDRAPMKKTMLLACSLIVAHSGSIDGFEGRNT